MNIGSLYTVKKWFWLLFPTKETAAVAVARFLPTLDAAASSSATAAVNAAEVAYWSKRYNCEVTYFSPDSYIVFLEEDGLFKKVLTSDGKIGWTVFYSTYNHCFEEMKTE
jgi:hypothetical protein